MILLVEEDVEMAIQTLCALASRVLWRVCFVGLVSHVAWRVRAFSYVHVRILEQR